jgi:catechol 2,3-dioxygenase-like lactoylglutathione lyase family enzyme
MTFEAPIPILRMFDEAKAREFYVDYLGFKVDWEHRFGDGFPLYMQVSRGDCRLHLSGHHGDCTPGSAVRIGVESADALLEEISEVGYRALRPGVEEMPWGMRELQLLDPFGNRIVFCSPSPARK